MSERILITPAEQKRGGCLGELQPEDRDPFGCGDDLWPRHSDPFARCSKSFSTYNQASIRRHPDLVAERGVAAACELDAPRVRADDVGDGLDAHRCQRLRLDSAWPLEQLGRGGWPVLLNRDSVRGSGA